MKKSELPLYLKISPIYNKILQLAIAVICIVVLMNLLNYSQNEHKAVISKHFSDSSKVQLSQAVLALKVLMVKKDRQAIEDFIKNLSAAEFIQDVNYYDETGLLVASSSETSSMNEFFNHHTDAAVNRTQYQTFVEEIRDGELLGYLRITINEKQVSKPLVQASFDVHEIMRLIALFSVVIGFFLTRGFSRFSRQGFRIAK
ncbi:MAG: AhpA/YtjB family protein [Thalassotalea sp.]